MTIHLEQSQAEREAFSLRLRGALDSAGYTGSGVTKITEMYVTRSQRVVSVHAVRKWLTAQSIPRQEHIQALATWLSCDSAWLRYGTSQGEAPTHLSKQREASVLTGDLALLDEDAKIMVRELVKVLSKKQRRV